MFTDRLRTLRRAYSVAERENKMYKETEQNVLLQKKQLDFIGGLHIQLKGLDSEITENESKWREAILSALEAEIVNDLAFVYPHDGYRVKLSSRVLRGKIHIDARVYSAFARSIPGKIRGTQGRLFQQVVSFGALVGVQSLLGVKTIYMDEAFSGASKANVAKLSALLASLRERGFNLVMIAQDTSMADGIGANRLFLSRSIDNKTAVQQKEGDSK